METTETVIVGAGQAGLALSHWLHEAGRPHIVLERGRIAQSWRDRWASLTLLTPNSLNRLPGAPALPDPDGFLTRDALVEHLQVYAAARSLPVLERVAVHRATRAPDGSFVVESDAGTWRSANLVVASGHATAAAVPALAMELPAAIDCAHTSSYHDPSSLPDGDVLVVGAGASGQQIAAELARAGRRVTIAVGRHRRLPRRYLGQDIFVWMQVLGDLDRTIDGEADPAAARRAPSAALSGRAGGEHLDLGVLRALGVELRGRLVAVSGGHAHFDASLPASASEADSALRSLLRRIDDHVGAHGCRPQHDRPAEDISVSEGPTRDVLPPVVVWATGYRSSHPWLEVAVPHRHGELVQRQGITDVPGLYVLGMRYQHRRQSHFIGGVGEDAQLLARRIARRATARAAA